MEPSVRPSNRLGGERGGREREGVGEGEERGRERGEGERETREWGKEGGRGTKREEQYIMQHLLTTVILELFATNQFS